MECPSGANASSTIPCSRQKSSRSHSGKYGWDSTCTTAGLIRATATISRNLSTVMSESPIALQEPSSMRLSSACHVSSNVTPVVIDHLAAVVSRVLVVAGLKGVGSVDQIAIDVVDLQSTATRIECGLDPLRAMIGVPQLRGDEQVFPRNGPRLERFPQRITHRRFVAVAFCAIEMSKTHFERGLGGLLGRDEIRNQRAESDRGNRTRSVGEWNPANSEAHRMSSCPCSCVGRTDPGAASADVARHRLTMVSLVCSTRMERDRALWR